MIEQAGYIHALRFQRLNQVYDPLLRYFLRENTFKRRLIQQAHIQPGQWVLDVGCGTGTLTLLIKQRHPDSDVIGMDGDPAILAQARVKALVARANLTFTQGLAFALPYSDNSFDRVLSSLVFHHLTREHKRRAMAEIYRVLRPGGEVHIADWGKPHNAVMRAAFLSVQMLDGFATTQDSVTGELIGLLADAGFQDARETEAFMTIMGSLCLYSARKDSSCSLPSAIAKFGRHTPDRTVG